MSRLILIVSLLVLSFLAQSQNRMSSAEISYLYDAEHEFLIDHRIAQRGNEVKIYVRFALNSGFVKITDYELRYDLRDNYISEKRNGSSIKLDSTHLIGTGFREFFYEIDINKTPSQNLAVVEVRNVIKNKSYYLDIPISTNANFPNPSFLIFDKDGTIPIFRNHVNIGTPIRIKDAFSTEGSFEINGQTNNKPVAMPPFDETRLNPPTKVLLDTIYGSNHDEIFTFNIEGLYTITDSNNKDNRIGILVTDKFFPYYGDYKRMTQPLIYISTGIEFNALRESTDTKDKFEDFVINTINDNPSIASDFVKYYYRRVKNAGYFFTDSQEGWKTDKGMLYQIFGNPRQVFRNETSELWVYAFQGGGRIRYTFDIQSGEGGIKEFSLIRGKKYREIWMSAVTRWRNGQVID